MESDKEIYIHTKYYFSTEKKRFVLIKEYREGFLEEVNLGLGPGCCILIVLFLWGSFPLRFTSSFAIAHNLNIGTNVETFFFSLFPSFSIYLWSEVFLGFLYFSHSIILYILKNHGRLQRAFIYVGCIYQYFPYYKLKQGNLTLTY